MKNISQKCLILICILLSFFLSGCNGSSNKTKRMTQKKQQIENIKKDKENQKAQFVEPEDNDARNINEPGYDDRSDIN